jgi:hypothetical protein
MKLLNECKITGNFQQKIILMKQLFGFICSNKWFCGMEKNFLNTVINKLIELIDELYDNPIHVHDIEIFNTFRQQLTINNTKDILNDSDNTCQIQLNLYYVSWSMCSKNMLPIWHNFIEDLKPRILLPQLSYRAKFRQGEYIGILGKFLISNTEIFFKPGKFNWGDLSDKYMKIVNINNMSIKKLGLATQLTITDNNGKEMRIVHSFLDFTNIKLNEVVSEINIRKNNLVLKK